MRNLCLLAAMCLPAIVLGSGCGLLRHMTYVLAPDPKITVKAEYDGLVNHKVALLVYADPEILYVRNHADAQVAMFVARAFQEGQAQGELAGVRLVPVAETIRFQSRQDWYNMDVVEIGRRFKADRVIYIELEDYSRREIGAVNLLRGRITATVKTYVVNPPGTPPPKKNPVYSTRIRQVWPEDSPMTETDQSVIFVERATLARFARKVARKFYTYVQEPAGR